MKKLRTWDPVIIIAWKYKWKTSSIVNIDWDYVIVQDINVVKKAVKWQWFVKKTLPIHISNIMYYLDKEKKWTKIKIDIKKDWKKERIAKITKLAVK